ncbi:MAG: hypothetical protein J6W29_07335 [Neisseriaceae bacterium]|nr:hypothetical protein [Neisseriaceae bacterium]
MSEIINSQCKNLPSISDTVHILLQSKALCEILLIDIGQDQRPINAEEDARRYEVLDVLKQKIQCAIKILEEYQLQHIK